MPSTAAPAVRPRRTRVESDPARTAEARAERLSSLEQASGVSSERLLALLEDCRDLQVSWALNKVLLVKMNVGGRVLEVFGIEPTGDVQVPWFISDAKDRFRGFAEILAAAIPGAIAYETPKMWRIRRREGSVSVRDIVDAPDGLRAALLQLNEALKA